MRFINSEQGYRHAIEHLQTALSQQPFRCHIEQIEFALSQRTFNAQGFIEALAGIEKRSAYAQLTERINLILHQRDQWRDDDTAAIAQQGRNLITQGFTAASRHEYQRITAARNQFNDIRLRTAKHWITEHAL